jgi:hypothetical protein
MDKIGRNLPASLPETGLGNARSAEINALPEPIALRITHGISTKPATGSHTRMQVWLVQQVVAKLRLVQHQQWQQLQQYPSSMDLRKLQVTLWL